MRYSEAEDAMRASVADDLPMYAVADATTEMLLRVIARSGFDAYDEGDDPPASYWRGKALLYLATLAVRTTRAAMNVLAAGYEGETLTYGRLLMEAHSRAQRVVDDHSGQYAREWLRGRAKKPAAAVKPYSPDDLWDMLSHSSHADHRAVENWLAISNDDGTTSLLTIRDRRPDVSNAMLAMFASETRDMACILAREHGVTIPHLAQLDAAIRSHPMWSEPEA